ncbi:CCT domain-containing protein [Psidium guajava]|nr:CCT domain-containing protein [Psidium guajava]
MCPSPANMKTRSKSSSMLGKPKKQTLSSLPNPSRRSRTKTRKPNRHRRRKHQLNLLPLHPQAHSPSHGDGYQDQLHDENDVALLFDSSAAAAGATLTGLLAPTSGVAAAPASSGEEEESAESSLIRCAMKSSSRERAGSSEEKWVCYSEVIVEAEKKAEMEEVTSCAADAWRGGPGTHPQGTMLSLKLDYQEILDAWSDKGSLFVCGGDANHEAPQTVPDLMRVDNGSTDGCENVWRVPEKAAESEATVEVRDVMTENSGGELSQKIRQREASVMRYKEKRHSRLFSKRIRYEVRKLNAQKRPRIKGRFVRRDSED